jgi:hypothetical protein
LGFPNPDPALARGWGQGALQALLRFELKFASGLKFELKFEFGLMQMPLDAALRQPCGGLFDF